MMSHNDDKTQIVSSTSSKKNVGNIDKKQFIGKKLSDRYLIEELIGQGGMSYIFRARDTFLERSSSSDHPVVIKILREEFSQSSEAIKLLKEETAQTQQLSHPNIVKIFTANTEGAIHYIVMEWVNGETLEQLIKRNRPTGLKFKNAKPIIQQIISALDYAHEQGVIHNDLKPSNIIITPTGNLKILDFGIAKQRTNDDIYAFIKKNDQEIVGGYTPSYASPEQLNGYTADVKDDFFSLGCIIYEVLSSRHPYNRKAANTLPINTKLKKPQNSPIIFWRELKATLSLNAEKRSNAITRLNRRLQRKPIFILPSLFLAAAITSGLAYTYNPFHSDTSQLVAERNNAQAINRQVNVWMSWGPEKTLNNLNSIPPQFNVLKQGLLKTHQQEIIRLFNEKIANVGNIEGNIKDFSAISKLYQQALNYYPDSLTLNNEYNNMQLERRSISMDIITRINSMLNQQRYYEKDQNNILILLHKLQLVDSRNTFKPTKTQTKKFEAALKKAQAKGKKGQVEILDGINKAIFSPKQEEQKIDK